MKNVFLLLFSFILVFNGVMAETNHRTKASFSNISHLVLLMEPGATATGGTLSCANSTVQLMGSSPTSGVIFSWTGPNGFSSGFQNPIVNIPGNYTLTVTDPETGLFSQAVAVVAIDIAEPGATATGGELSCTIPVINIAGDSPTPGVSYNWSGPNGFSSNFQNPAVNIAGDYILTVTDPSNGCTSTATASVTGNSTPPDVTVTGGALECTSPITQVSASSSVPGVTYSWTGPDGFTSVQPTATVTQPGEYTVLVTDPANGCTTEASVTVTSDGNEPGATAVGGTISSAQPTIQLQGGSPTLGVLYNWFGPGAFTSNEQNPVVDYPGYYILTVIDPLTGCASVGIAYVELIQDACITINLSLFLEGPYNVGEGTMNKVLNTDRGLLPGQTPANPLITPTPSGNPYRGAPWYYEGTVAEETYSGPYTNGDGLSVTDWVLVSFRASPSPADQFLQATGLLYEDGHVEFIEPCLLDTSSPSSVWIMIEHRNHVGIMTDSAVVIQDGVLTHDFRQTESYRTTASFGQKQIEPGIYVMFAADGHQYDFPGFDINGSDNFMWQQENGQFDQYMIGDFNLNGDVNGEDNFLLNANNGIFSIVPKD